jgi:hypothetical protein
MVDYKTDHDVYKACRKLELTFERKLGKSLNTLFEQEFYIKAHDGFIFFNESKEKPGLLYTLRFIWNKDLSLITDLIFDPTCSYYKTLPLFIENKKWRMLELINSERTLYRASRLPFLNK